MKMVSTAELKTHANRLLKFVENGKKPVVITRHGKPCAVLQPCTEEDLDALAFEYGPEVLRMARESAADMKAKKYVTLKKFAQKHGLA
ncbi:MAG: type II toxin-antitoxin system Phd/YefM family antitoxin [Elusimicrobia bacterium]|nr:type II toxin-antitoxin system Phd/YefM family antitoxin [Elusimicrobiota bacterium]